MKCPYCEKEMASGYIPNGDQPVQWIPDGKRPSWFRFSTSKYGVTLKNWFSPLTGYEATAYYCKECGIVIAPMDSEGK